MEPTITVQHNFEKDTIDVTKDYKTVSIPRSLASAEACYMAQYKAMQQVGCSEDDISLWQPWVQQLRGLGAAQNAYPYCSRKVFPRNTQELDEIMMRRVNARLQLKQEKFWRHMKIAAISVAAAWLFPVLVAAILRTWGACAAWVAS